MTENNDREAESPEPGAPAAENTRNGAEESIPGVDAMALRLKELETIAAQNLEGWQRTQAEFQNYRKRVERDSELARVVMKASIISSILPVLDDLERALQNRPAEPDTWVSGIELIRRKLQSMLEAEGVRKIEVDGAAFDPNLHEAISHEEAPGVESGHVIAATRNGYAMGDRVIRPAVVRVAK